MTLYPIYLDIHTLPNNAKRIEMRARLRLVCSQTHSGSCNNIRRRHTFHLSTLFVVGP